MTCIYQEDNVQKILDMIGLMAMPRKSSHLRAFKR